MRKWGRRAYAVWTNAIPLIALLLAYAAIVNVENEAAERKDQNCVVFERDAVSSVAVYEESKRRYDATLDFLARARDDTDLIREIKRALPRTRSEVESKWREAKAAAAPPYCDEDNVGLDEPNPKLPPAPFT